MKPNIIAYNCLLEDQILLLLKDFDVHFFKQGDDLLHPAVQPLLADAEAIICAGLQVDKELISRMPRLKAVSNISVGYDNLSIEDLTASGVMATNTPEILNDTVADAIFGLLLATARRIPELHQYVEKGAWTKDIGPDKFGVDVHHKKLGIIGLGKVGEAIAQRAHLGFDMEILYHNRTPNKQAENRFNAQYCSLEELLQKSDFVCLMVPGQADNKKIMGENEFRLMKKTAIFINGSRGRNVDDSALVTALTGNTIAAAGLDVLSNEPPGPDNPLIGLPNVVITPHIGSATYETELKMATLAAENVIAGVIGKKPGNLLNEVLVK